MGVVQGNENGPAFFLFDQDLTVKQAAVLFHLGAECKLPRAVFL